MTDLCRTVCWAVLAVLALAGCHAKATLDRSRVQHVRVDGRRFEVRVAPTDTAGEFRILVVRATFVIDPDPELEHSRGWNVARPFMERTCRGSYQVLHDQLVDSINLFIRFRCSA